MLRFVTVLVSKGLIIEGPYVTCDLDPEGTRELWKVLSQSDQGCTGGREAGEEGAAVAWAGAEASVGRSPGPALRDSAWSQGTGTQGLCLPLMLVYTEVASFVFCLTPNSFCFCYCSRCEQNSTEMDTAGISVLRQMKKLKQKASNHPPHPPTHP